MDLENKLQEIFTLIGCLLYGFMLGYLISEMLYGGEVRIGIVAGGLALGYFLKVLLFRQAFK